MTEPRWLTQEIEDEARRLVRVVEGRDLDPRVLHAMATVPRQEFVPPRFTWSTYEDNPLPIGFDQTISQPSLVLLMTDALEVGTETQVLEVGTGSGYQAAILSRLAARVYSVEIVEALAAEAAARLGRLGFVNVEVRYGNGAEGWKEHAPFGAICVTAGAEAVPPQLVEQLAPGGRMVIPVGGELLRLTKDEAGRVAVDALCPVSFVPLVGEARAGRARRED